MKKILLGTTVLMSALTLAGAAHADGMKSTPVGGLSVGIGGFADFQAGFADQGSAYEVDNTTVGTSAPAFSRESRFQTDAEIHVTVEGVADNGLKYGAVIELNADPSADGDNDGGNSDKTYLFLESSAGRVELGANSPVTTTMQVSAASIARATGGIDGDWYDFVNLSGVPGSVVGDITDVFSPTASPFITTQELPSAAAGEGAAREDANKISYYSPVFSGFQFGVSYTPDEGDSGTVGGATGKLNGDNENVFDLGLSYSADFDGVGVNTAVVGEFGESEVAGTEDTAAWGLGLAVDYMGFGLAGSYTDWADSGLTTGAVVDDQSAWTVGASYETGPFGVSVTYLDSEGANLAGTAANEFQNLVIGADYTLAPGLVPYVEVSFFDTDDGNPATTDNDGNVILVGAELTF